jgi:hypothetical protein
VQGILNNNTISLVPRSSGPGLHWQYSIAWQPEGTLRKNAIPTVIQSFNSFHIPPFLPTKSLQGFLNRTERLIPLLPLSPVPAWQRLAFQFAPAPRAFEWVAGGSGGKPTKHNGVSGPFQAGSRLMQTQDEQLPMSQAACAKV